MTLYHSDCGDMVNWIVINQSFLSCNAQKQLQSSTIMGVAERQRTYTKDFTITVVFLMHIVQSIKYLGFSSQQLNHVAKYMDDQLYPYACKVVVVQSWEITHRLTALCFFCDLILSDVVFLFLTATCILLLLHGELVGWLLSGLLNMHFLLHSLNLPCGELNIMYLNHNVYQ